MRLILFDVDGTLVDSQAHIVGSMTAAFEALGLVPPARDETLSIVGLSLPQAMARLAPDAPNAALVDAYKESYQALAASHGAQSISPLFPGIRDLLDTLKKEDETLLGVATGKSRRGLEHVIAAHGLQGYFITLQHADGHPSKPHPSMALAALRDAGLETGVMVGDTTFDMEMGQAAGMTPVGVSWGYHDRESLAAVADHVADDAEALLRIVNEVSG